MIKRSLQFGSIYWAIIFVLMSIVLFLPFSAGNIILQHGILWLVLVPVTLGLTKWYFREVDPTPINGIKLWAVTMTVGFILDNVVTVPLFIAQEFNGDTMAAFQSFYTNWMLYVGFIWSLVLMIYAGYEADRAPHLGVRKEQDETSE